MNSWPTVLCECQLEKEVGREAMPHIQRDRQLWNTGCGTLPLLLPARGTGIPGVHSFNKCLLRDFFVLACMPGALITQFLPVAIRILAANNSNQVVPTEGFRMI